MAGCYHATIKIGGSEMRPKESTIQDLIQRAKAYLPPEDLGRIQKAFEFAQKAHCGQCRMSHEPYICHPLEVAITLAELEQDSSTIVAGLLHDTLEDCQVTPEDIQREFGEEIYQLVDGVTKLGKLDFRSEEEHLVENFRKMFLAMAKDLRVILIKITDRLHNMRTLKYLPPDRQQRMARETREIFAPLAHRLGMGSIKWELEDLCFYYLEPEAFQKVKNLVSARREEREFYIQHFIDSIQELVYSVCPDAKIVGRPKHFYSIYKKLIQQKCSFDDLYDTLGVRVIVHDLRECYEIFGLVHSKYKPVSHRIKDFIAMPKSNMYQSLHTTIIGPDGKFLELQIRTVEMDQIAEYGIAAHWKYKEGLPHDKRPDVDFSWLRQILESQDEKASPNEYLQNIKLNLFEDEVFIFTPKGDVQSLPKGAVPLDFAYKIHTEVGHRYTGAKVNGEIVSLDYVLRNGDRVDILTSKVPNPKIHWLNLVKTNQAKNKIKQWFKKQTFQKSIEKGKEALEEDLNQANYVPKEVLVYEKLEDFLTKHHCKKLEDLYFQIGLGEMNPQTVVKYLNELQKPSSDSLESSTVSSKTFGKPRPLSKHGVRVQGATSIDVHFSKCCNPVPGDEIIGFVTKGCGVSIHRKECRNISTLPEEQKARLMEAEWDQHEREKLYPATLIIEAFDRLGLLKDIIGKITETKTNIVEIKSKTIHAGGNAKIELVVDIRDFDHLNELKSIIKGISDVYAIYRA